MATQARYSNIILGSGEGGKYLAWHLGDRIFLNLGTHATIPDIPGLSAVQPMTNVETLELDRVGSRGR